MNRHENIEVQKRFGEAINSGDLDALNDLVSAEVFDHDPAPGQLPGPAGYIEFFKSMRTAFPDMHIEVDKLIADGDCVSFAYTLTGTNYGEFRGLPASENSVKIRGMQISRFKDGKMVERWGSSDEMALMKQIGVLVELQPK